MLPLQMFTEPRPRGSGKSAHFALKTSLSLSGQRRDHLEANGDTLAAGGIPQKPRSAKLLTTGQPVRFEQEEFRIRFLGLPKAVPDPLVSVLTVEFDEEPIQSTDSVRKSRKREGV